MQPASHRTITAAAQLLFGWLLLMGANAQADVYEDLITASGHEALAQARAEHIAGNLPNIFLNQGINDKALISQTQAKAQALVEQTNLHGYMLTNARAALTKAQAKSLLRYYLSESGKSVSATPLASSDPGFTDTLATLGEAMQNDPAKQAAAEEIAAVTEMSQFMYDAATSMLRPMLLGMLDAAGLEDQLEIDAALAATIARMDTKRPEFEYAAMLHAYFMIRELSPEQVTELTGVLGSDAHRAYTEALNQAVLQQLDEISVPFGALLGEGLKAAKQG